MLQKSMIEWLLGVLWWVSEDDAWLFYRFCDIFTKPRYVGVHFATTETSLSNDRVTVAEEF